MNVDQLLQQVQEAGVILRADPPDLVISPPGRLTPELRAHLREHKAELLHHLERTLSRNAAPTTIETKEDFQACRQRLEALGVSVAIWNDGSMCIVVTESETMKAIDDGGAIYSPADMLHFVVDLTPNERRLFHRFKKAFGGTTEWRKQA